MMFAADFLYLVLNFQAARADNDYIPETFGWIVGGIGQNLASGR
jgi:hypothetical protein